MFKKDRDLQSIILFNLIQAIQSCIDVGTHIIADMELGSPETLAEVFEILSENKIISGL